MLTSELGWHLITLAQPLALAALVALSLRYSLLHEAVYLRVFGVRQRTQSIRFFECAAFARLVGRFRSHVQGLFFCILFILYDVDAFFFIPAVLEADSWAYPQLGLGALCLVLLVFGLLYDLLGLGLGGDA